jgi:hypothetical protein
MPSRWMTRYVASNYPTARRRTVGWVLSGFFFALGVTLLIGETTNGRSNGAQLVFASCVTAAGLIQLVLLSFTLTRRGKSRLDSGEAP